MTIICICGLKGSGKTTLARKLRDSFGYIQVKIKSSPIISSSSHENGTEKCHEVDNNDNDEDTISFSNAEEALEELTSRWMENFVISDLLNACDYELLLKRPFAFIVEIVAPIASRLSRLRNSGSTATIDPLEMLQVDDMTLFTPLNLAATFRMAKVTIINNNSLDRLSELIVSNSLHEDKWVRPSWDSYFMEMAELASQRSNCMKRSVGAILVKDRRVVATGYNGTAKGLVNCRSGGCIRCNSNARCGVGLNHCFCLHAEENALLEAGRVRSEGGTLYCTTAPCLGCSQKIIQSGLVRVVYAKDYSIEHNAQAMMSQVGVELVKFINPTPQVLS